MIFGQEIYAENNFVQIHVDDETLVYEVMTPEFSSCAYYRGFLVVQDSQKKPGATSVLYRNIWLPIELDKVSEVQASMKKSFIKRFQWMKEYYEAKHAGVTRDADVEEPEKKEPIVENDSGHDDPGGNLVLPVMQGKYKQEVQFTIAGQLDDVWEVIQDFGVGCENWWMHSNFLQFEGDEAKQYLGCTRRVSRKGQVVRDKLIFISPNDYKLMFEALEWIPNPYGFQNYSVLLSLEPGHREPDDETEVLVTVKYDCPAVIQPTIDSQQNAQILDSLRRLNDLFKKPVGQIEITLVNAEDLGLDRNSSIDPYCSISVDNGEVIDSTVVKATSNPKWNESFNFRVYSASSVVNVALWDKISASDSETGPFENNLLGIITFELPNKPKSIDTKYKVNISTGNIYFKIKFSNTPNNSKSHSTKPSVVRQVNYLRDCLVATYLDLPQLRNDKFLWKVQKRLKNAEHIPMENLPGYWEVVPHMERTNPANMSTVLSELATCTSSFRGQVVSQKTNPKSRVEGIYCKYLPIPSPVLENYENDNDFCMRFFIGLAPNLVVCVKHLSQVPASIRNQTLEGDLVDLITKKSLYMVLLNTVSDFSSPTGSILNTPTIVFSGDFKEGFKIHGIVLSSADNDVYTATSVENAYRLSKLYLSNAVIIHHLYFNVLLRNFFLESICFAIHKDLPSNHPVRKILLPCLNEIAHKAVFLRKIFTDSESCYPDYVFSIGKVNGIDMISKYSRSREVADSFFDVAKDFENRGFDTPNVNYLHQHDVIRLLDVITHEISQYLSKHFKIDRDVESDEKLQSFFDTLIDPSQCNLNLFPDGVKTRLKLANFIASVIFSATAHTSAFEKNLYDEGSLLAGMATSMTKPMPKPDEPCPDNLFDYFFAPNDELFLQVLLCRVLSVNTSQSLAQHSSVMGHKLSDKLLKLSTDIKNRNSQLRSENKKCSFVEYSRLDPFNIPSVAGL